MWLAFRRMLPLNDVESEQDVKIVSLLRPLFLLSRLLLLLHGTSIGARNNKSKRTAFVSNWSFRIDEPNELRLITGKINNLTSL